MQIPTDADPYGCKSLLMRNATDGVAVYRTDGTVNFTLGDTNMTHPNFRMTHYTDKSDVQSEYFKTLDDAVKAAKDTLREMDSDGLVGQVEILANSPEGFVHKVGNYYSAAMEAQFRDVLLTA